MKEIIEKLEILNYWFAPISLLALIIIIGFSVGFINGWKTSLYFLCWNISTLLIVIFAFGPIFDQVASGVVIDFIDNLIIDNHSSPEVEQSVLAILKPVLILAFLIAIALVMNLIALIIYLFIRKKLKRSIKENKSQGRSNTISRFVGAGIGTISALPIAVAAGDLATGVSLNKNVNRLADGLAELITIGQAHDVSEDIHGVYGLFGALEAETALEAIFSGDASSITPENMQKLEDSVPSLEKALASDKAQVIVDSLATSLSGGDPSQITVDKLNQVAQNVESKGRLSKLSDSAKVKLKQTLTLSILGADSSNVDVAKETAFNTMIDSLFNP